MSGLKYWFQKGSFSLINRFTVFFFGFTSYMVLVRYLDKADFGLYTIYMIIVTFVEMSRNAFIQNGFVKYFVNKNYDKNEVFTAALVLNLVLTTVVAGILMLLSGLIGDMYGSGALVTMIVIYCSLSLVMVPFSQLSYYFNATVNFKVISIISFARYASFFLGAVVIYFYFPGLGLVDIAILHVGSILVGTLASLVFFGLVENKKFSYNYQLVVLLFNFGKYTFGTGLTSLITRSVDQLMIGYFIGSEAVASYNVAGRFMNFIEIPIASISQVLYPKFANTVNSDEPSKEQGRLFERSTGMILAAIMPFILVLFIFPSFFITIVAGTKYLDAVPILQIFIAFNILKPFGTQAGSVLEVAGKPKVIFYALLFSTTLNILFNYILIQMEGPYGGMIGAAIASVLSGSFFLVVALIAVFRETKYSNIGVIKYFIEGYKIGLSVMKQKFLKRANS